MKKLISVKDIYRVDNWAVTMPTLDLVNEYYKRSKQSENPLRSTYYNMILAILSTCEISGTFRIEELSRTRIYDELEKIAP